MKIKHFLSICAVGIFAVALLVGCSSESTEDTQTPTETTSTDSTQADTSKDTTSSSPDDSKKKSSSIQIPWYEVSDEYEDAAAESRDELVNAATITRDDLKALVKTIRKDYKAIKKGVTKSNKDSAKEMFVIGEKIEALTERGSNLSEEEFILLGTSAKKYVKALHGGGSAALSDANYDLDTSLNVVKNLGNDRWNALVKKLN
ncbi:MAG: hypothetical protein ACI4SQ_01650 [Eubacterium sp.]